MCGEVRGMEHALGAEPVEDGEARVDGVPPDEGFAFVNDRAHGGLVAGDGEGHAQQAVQTGFDLRAGGGGGRGGEVAPLIGGAGAELTIGKILKNPTY